MVRPAGSGYPRGRLRHLFHRARNRDRPGHGRSLRGAARRDRSAAQARAARGERHRPAACGRPSHPGRRSHGRLPPPGQGARPRDEAGRRRVPVWRREGRVLLCGRGARRFSSARQGPVLDAAHSRRHAPDRRARRDPPGGRLCPVRTGALLYALWRTV